MKVKFQHESRAVSKQKDPKREVYRISKSEPKFSSISWSQNKDESCGNVMPFESFSDTDCVSDQEQIVFLGTGFDWKEREKNESFPRTIKTVSNILSFLSPTPGSNHRKLL